MADTYAELFTEAFERRCTSCPGSGDYATRVTAIPSSRARAATIVASTNSTTPWPAPGAGILRRSHRRPQRLRDSVRSSAPSARSASVASNTSRQFTSRRAGDRGAPSQRREPVLVARLQYSVGEGDLNPTSRSDTGT